MTLKNKFNSSKKKVLIVFEKWIKKPPSQEVWDQEHFIRKGSRSSGFSSWRCYWAERGACHWLPPGALVSRSISVEIRQCGLKDPFCELFLPVLHIVVGLNWRERETHTHREVLKLREIKLDSLLREGLDSGTCVCPEQPLVCFCLLASHRGDKTLQI